jgi:catechol 2,3-dioxygenase-like lactoylglutathione lyase family enzyme
VSVRRLDHVSLTVADLDRSLAFWRDALGLELLGRGEVTYPHLDRIVGAPSPTTIEWADLAVPGGLVVELFRFRAPDGSPVRPDPWDPGSNHVCLAVDGLDALVERLHAAGYATRSPAAVEIPVGDWRGHRDIYVIDPDGFTVELTEGPRGSS